MNLPLVVVPFDLIRLGEDSQTRLFLLLTQPEPSREPICASTFIDKAFHNATIAIDEEGTVAAAATAVLGTKGGGAPESPPSITFDHPFVFFIRDEATNAVLFAGQF